MDVFTLNSYGSRVVIEAESHRAVEGLIDLFPRRYIPSFSISKGFEGGESHATIKWLEMDEGFEVINYSLGARDEYLLRSAKPEPYTNESPYFFLLQVLSRIYVRRGILMLTDTVAIYDRSSGVAHLFMGYPHTGKSTVTALALSYGYIPLTTENTLLRVGDSRAYIVGGTNVLVYDPVIKEVYGVSLRPSEYTRHGYGVVDLKDLHRGLPWEIPIATINLLYCSFTSSGANFKEVRGRKAMKTLWHFATAVIKGTDYYEPHPLDLSDKGTDAFTMRELKKLTTIYAGSFKEAFGSHREVLLKVLKGESS